MRPNVRTSKAIGVNPISKKKKNSAQKLWFRRGESPKAPLALESHGRDKARCGVKEIEKCQAADVK